MDKKILAGAAAVCLLLAGCGKGKTVTPTGSDDNPSRIAEETTTATTAAAETTTTTTAAPETTSAAETTAAPETTSEKVTAPQQEVGFEGMEAISGDKINDGEYHINVDSSSSMFKIADCVLNVKDGSMTADIIIDSKSYGHLFPGSAEDAEKAAEADLIGYESDAEGRSVFSFPIEALDKEVPCAAFSVKKETWYDRTLVFRSDSLPDEAFKENRWTDASSLGLADGEYTADVKLEGGSGRASVQSPAKLTVKDGNVTAEIVWSSNKYDYMLVDGEKILPTSTEEFSVFEIPVKGFDYNMPVAADTTAMSTPYEIEYTLYFDSATIK